MADAFGVDREEVSKMTKKEKRTAAQVAASGVLGATAGGIAGAMLQPNVSSGRKIPYRNAKELFGRRGAMKFKALGAAANLRQGKNKYALGGAALGGTIAAGDAYRQNRKKGK